MGLSFQDFLTSKHQLMEATLKDPVVTVDYTVSKYCKIPTGASKDKKQYIAVKPNDVVHITWICETLDSPIPSKIKINETEHDLFYNYAKVKSWLFTNTFPKNPKCDLLV